MKFIDFIHVFEQMFENGMLQKDPNNENRMLVYRKAGEKYPEGWYSENILDTVSEAFNNESDKAYILKRAIEAGIEIKEEIGHE